MKERERRLARGKAAAAEADEDDEDESADGDLDGGPVETEDASGGGSTVRLRIWSARTRKALGLEGVGSRQQRANAHGLYASLCADLALALNRQAFQ
jgi:hypothetical protein